MPTPQLDKEVKIKIIDTVDFILSRPYQDIAMGDPLKARDEMRRLMVIELEKLLATELEAQKQVFVEMIEGMTGIQNNPDFFIELQEQLKYNAFAQGVPDVALTQIIWEAKDKTLSDLLKRIKGA
jgi:hypothetical protein